MIVDHADPLHERIGDRRADKAEATPFHVFREPVAERCRGWHVGQRFEIVDDRAAVDKVLQIGCEAAPGALKFEYGPDIRSGAGYLQPVANNASVLSQWRHLFITHFHDTGNVEIMEGAQVTGTLAKHKLPAQSRMRAFKGQHLEQLPVVMNGNFPFGVMVMGKIFLSPAIAEKADKPVRELRGISHGFFPDGTIRQPENVRTRSTMPDTSISPIRSRR